MTAVNQAAFGRLLRCRTALKWDRMYGGAHTGPDPPVNCRRCGTVPWTIRQRHSVGSGCRPNPCVLCARSRSNVRRRRAGTGALNARVGFKAGNAVGRPLLCHYRCRMFHQPPSSESHSFTGEYTRDDGAAFNFTRPSRRRPAGMSGSAASWSGRSSARAPAAGFRRAI